MWTVWHRPGGVPANRPTGQPVDWAAPCGPVLCLTGKRELEAVDPRTGAVRWRGVGWYVSARGGRLVAVSTALGMTLGVGVVDPQTGRTLLDLRPWVVHAVYGQESELVLTRSAATTGRTTVALIDLNRLSVQVVGVIPGEAVECQAAAAHLVCPYRSKLQLWAYRRAG